ncbi:UNVERIFIED_CONTAM: hypothetical protein HDU68_006868 [Siphonaria sp. JEL0065]|nr:hypothetical protein HDU68_006868 [Siphonaria sp. JEL0065]
MAAVASELQRCARQYLQCTPLRHFDFGPTISARLDSTIQSQILLATIDHNLAQRYPPPGSYTAKFLKHLISRIETQKSKDNDDSDNESGVGVCNEDLLERYMACLMIKTPDNEMAYRSYSMVQESDTPLFATLAENSQTISNGTTGLRTWPAALSLVSYLIVQAKESRGLPKQTVELGCGVGLVGIACGVLGVSSSIDFTDVDTTVLDTVTRNCAINFGGDVDSGKGTVVETRVSQLDWEVITDSALKDRVASIEADFVVASDVAYDPVIVPPFVRVLNAFLRRDNGGTTGVEALVATTRRAESTFDLFLSELGRYGLNYETLKVSNLGLFYFDEPGQIDVMRIYAGNKGGH